MTSTVASDFSIESSIQLKSNLNKRGTVIGNRLSDGDQVVAVEWEDGTLTKVNVNDIQICLSMEEEFSVMVEEVNDKLKQAADLILEANELASKKGKNLQSTDDRDYDRLFEIGHIENAMEEAGWQTSSWYC